MRIFFESTALCLFFSSKRAFIKPVNALLGFSMIIVDLSLIIFLFVTIDFLSLNNTKKAPHRYTILTGSVGGSIVCKDIMNKWYLQGVLATDSC